MIRIYFLPVVTIDGTDTVVGCQDIHDALLDGTEDPIERKLTMDTNDSEHAWLIAVANTWRTATPEEIDNYNSYGFPDLPSPDTIRAEEILSNPSIPIPATDLAELVRIFGRRLGYDF